MPKLRWRELSLYVLAVFFVLVPSGLVVREFLRAGSQVPGFPNPTRVVTAPRQIASCSRGQRLAVLFTLRSIDVAAGAMRVDLAACAPPPFVRSLRGYRIPPRDVRGRRLATYDLFAHGFTLARPFRHVHEPLHLRISGREPPIEFERDIDLRTILHHATRRKSRPVRLKGLNIPLVGSPRRYPLDGYYFNGTVELLLPSTVVTTRLIRRRTHISATGVGSLIKLSRNQAQTSQQTVAQPGLSSFAIQANGSPGAPGYFGVHLARHVVDKLFVAVLAVIPLLLAVLLLTFSPRNRDDVENGFPREFALGLAATLLAILPIRAVLVPPEIGVRTLLDYALGAEVGLLAAVTCLLAARALRT